MERLRKLELQLTMKQIKVMEGNNFLKITDNRTGKSYDVTIKDTKDAYFVNAKDFAKISSEDK